jgi:hypothetical protein
MFRSPVGQNSYPGLQMPKRSRHSTAHMFEEGEQYRHEKNVFRVGTGPRVDDALDGCTVLLKCISPSPLAASCVVMVNILVVCSDGDEGMSDRLPRVPCLDHEPIPKAMLREGQEVCRRPVPEVLKPPAFIWGIGDFEKQRPD